MADSQHHSFLGADHAQAERRTWAVIRLCDAMMVLEVAGGRLFGSNSAGGRWAAHENPCRRAAVGGAGLQLRTAPCRRSAVQFLDTGKLGDVAGFTSAIALAMISLLIGYESLMRLLAPQPMRLGEALPIAVLDW